MSLPPPISPGKLWLFRLTTAVAIPALLLLALEGGLRLCGYGHSAKFLIPDERPGNYRTNPDYVSLFLPASFDLRPLNYRVAMPKPANTVRVVVLGESAAQGIPVPAFAFAPQLRAQLRARFPGKNIEVINTGVVAINSHVVAQIARDLAEFSPDLFVVYLGNNEVVGPYGPGCSYLSQSWPRWLIRLNVWVRSTRTGQLLGSAVARVAAARRPPQEWGGMAMFVDHAVRGDDPRLETVYQNLEANLRDIVSIADAAGAKTLLCTVVSNLKDSPPFLSLHRPDLSLADLSAWQLAFAKGRLAWRLGENDVARKQLEAAANLDPQYADTLFMLGSLDLQADDTVAARAHFLAAQHWDALRFRPDPRLNEIVRRVAQENPGAALADAAVPLGSDPASTVAPAGRELFFEHVHFDWEGNYLLARLLAEKSESLLFGTVDAKRPDWLDSAGCADALAYTPHERFSILQHTALITQGPPFTNQLTYCEDEVRLAREMARAEVAWRDPAGLQRAQATASTAATRDASNSDLAKIQQEIADDLGDVAEALAQSRRAQQLQPWSFALATDEAIKLARLERYDEAEKLLRATAARCGPRDLAKMGPAFADFFTRTKRFDEGRRWFAERMASYPNEVQFPLALAKLEEAAGDTAAADARYRAVLTRAPDNSAALEALVALLTEAGKKADAEVVSMASVDRQPRNQANNFLVAGAYEARGDMASAVRYYEAATTSGPAPAAIQLRLANQLYRQGRKIETLEHLAMAWRISLGEGDPEITAAIRRLIDRVKADTWPTG